MKNKKNNSTTIWNKYYQDFEKGDWLGNQYPNEFLIRFVSNLRKKYTTKDYFKDTGKEIKLKKNYNGNALEIGFGGLANLLMLRSKGFSCNGVEVSENAVKRAKSYIKKNNLKKIKISLWEKNNRLPYRDNTFDLVVGLQCIYYNTDLRFVIKEVRRVLKKNGKFIFSFFSKHHGYMNYVDVVNKQKNLIRWSKKHPNQRIVGSELYNVKTKKNLSYLFKYFKSKKIFTFETDQLPIFQSWWYITGKK